MAKYIVDYYETYGKTYEVEANSKEEAEEIVKDDIMKGRRESPYNCTDSWCEVEEINESYLIDGVATCCGYDFGIDMYKVKFCPICGKKLIIEERNRNFKIRKENKKWIYKIFLKRIEK